MTMSLAKSEIQQGDVGVDLSFFRAAVLGGSALIALVGAIGIWSIAVPLASATLAIGTVVVESDRKVVQHLDGGVVTKIHVHDGDLVEVNQPLLDLDDTRPLSTVATLKPLLLMNTAQIERLTAERNGAPDMVTDPSLVETGDPRYARYEEEQKLNFEVRRNGLRARIDAQEEERRQYRATVVGLRQQLTACQTRFDLDQQDLSGAVELAANGFGTRQRVRELQRHLASDRGECSSLSARITETEHRADQTLKEVDRVRANFAESVESERQQASKEHLDLIDRYRTASDQLNRSRILAPARGYIVNMVVHTIGGVIGPGMALLEIVPDKDPLVVEAQITPSEAQAVKTRQSVRIRLAGDDGKDAPLVAGTVVSVSADRIYDRQRSMAFFVVRVAVDPGEVLRVRSHGLRPGMSVELMIERGHRTLIDYLLSPVFAWFANALHE